MRISFLLAAAEYRNVDGPRGRCQHAIRVGLNALGHDVEIDDPDNGGHIASTTPPPDAAFIWNGVKGGRVDAVRAMRQAGVPVYIMERGFFNRMYWTQIDTKGFNHRASWCCDMLCEPAPLEGRGRFEAVWGAPVVPLAPREGGYILVLGQTSGDAQLSESEVTHPKPLIQAMERALPDKYELVFRPHPVYAWRCRGTRATECVAGSLKEAVAGARFVVTINSNSGNEALAWGCPVVAFGPAPYCKAGAATPASVSQLPDVLLGALRGEVPDAAVVENYLYHLACRQYGIDELRSGEALVPLLTQP